MNQPSPTSPTSDRKPYTPNHSHSLDSHNGSSRCARLIQHPRKSRLRFLEKHGRSMVEIGNSAMRHVCERAQVICVPITMRSAIPRPHLATQGWHCQGFLASHAASPLSVGSARDYWRGAGARHSALALPGFLGKSHSGLAVPGFSGAGRVLATQRWHCQDSVARGGSSPLLHIPVSDWHVTELAIASIIVAMQDRRRRAAHGAVRSDA